MILFLEFGTSHEGIALGEAGGELALFLYYIHCVQKKTPTHIFFHISMNYLWI